MGSVFLSLHYLSIRVPFILIFTAHILFLSIVLQSCSINFSKEFSLKLNNKISPHAAVIVSNHEERRTMIVP